MQALRIFAFAAYLLTDVASAQSRTEPVQFPGATVNSNEFPAISSVNATLSLPNVSTNQRVPAVVLLHGSGGIDGRGAYHATGFNQAGFATLEVHMFDRGQRPREGHTATLSHAYGALKYLASRSDIDANGIGVMGFSWGGNMALRMSSAKVRDAFSNNLKDLGFAAHVAFYPVCWFHNNLLTSTDASTKDTYTVFTSAPVWIAIGELDDYGDPQDCPEFSKAVTEASKGTVAVTVYPGGTHGWDVPGGSSRTVYDPSARKGKGGQVRMFADSRLATQSRAEAIRFFEQHLKRP